MAWSDAARAAALEARRRHRHTYVAFKAEAANAPVLNKHLRLASPTMRKQLATKLRVMRSGKVKNYGGFHSSVSSPLGVISMAVLSTKARNAIKKHWRVKRMK